MWKGTLAMYHVGSIWNIVVTLPQSFKFVLEFFNFLNVLLPTVQVADLRF